MIKETDIKTVGDLLQVYKINDWLKVESKRNPYVEWYITDCVFDEIKRSRIILKAQRTIQSERTNVSTSIITNLQFFRSVWPLYVYFKDKIVTLPVVGIKRSTTKKCVYLIVP